MKVFVYFTYLNVAKLRLDIEQKSAFLQFEFCSLSNLCVVT